jgi:hypothetical protein
MRVHGRHLQVRQLRNGAPFRTLWHDDVEVDHVGASREGQGFYTHQRCTHWEEFIYCAAVQVEVQVFEAATVGVPKQGMA